VNEGQTMVTGKWGSGMAVRGGSVRLRANGLRRISPIKSSEERGRIAGRSGAIDAGGATRATKSAEGGQMNISLNGIQRDNMIFEEFRGATPESLLRLCAIGVRRISPMKTSEEHGVRKLAQYEAREKFKIQGCMIMDAIGGIAQKVGQVRASQGQSNSVKPRRQA
jgi:hypothetical protein